MHQIVCRLGLCPRPHWGSLHRSLDPNPIAGLGVGTTWNGKEGGEGREGNGREAGRASRNAQIQSWQAYMSVSDKGEPATSRYLNLLSGRKSAFSPCWATHCTDLCQVWRGREPRGSASSIVMQNFTSISSRGSVRGPENISTLW